MTVSELIEKPQRIKETHPDVRVGIKDIDNDVDFSLHVTRCGFGDENVVMLYTENRWEPIC